MIKMKAAIFIVWLTFALTDIVHTQNDDGPLFLSPYIQRGEIQAARFLSRVHAEEYGFNLHSHSAFLTVGPSKNIHYNFWYFEALENPRHVPFIVWMTGGPGVTALDGLFGEIGPYYVTGDGRVLRRETSWLSKYNLIFLDTPAGTGFSFAQSRTGLANTTREIAEKVTDALDQFFTLFPPSANQDVYLAGEGYASKHAIGVACLITTLRRQHSFNLRGILLVSGFIDPVIQFRPASFLHQTGVITAAGRHSLENELERLHALISQSRYVEASRLYSKICNDLAGYSHSFFRRESGILGSGSIMRDVLKPEMSSFISLIDRTPGLKRALHVGSKTEFRANNNDVKERFVESGEYAKSMITELQVVLDANFKVLFFTGNMDIVNPAVNARAVTEHLRWRCQDQYVNATNRQIWRVHKDDANSAGYVKCACNLCKGTVRNAGHYVAGDEPIRALDLVDRFIHNRSFGTYVV